MKTIRSTRNRPGRRLFAVALTCFVALSAISLSPAVAQTPEPEAPSVEPDTRFSIEGDATITALVGAPATAVLETYSITETEPEVEWSLGGDHTRLFSLNSSGELRFNNGPHLDSAEVSASYDVTINATTDHYAEEDGASYTVSHDVVVTVERPFTVGGFTDTDIELLESSTRNVVNLTATNTASNPDGTVQWSIDGTDAEYFTLSSEGVVSFNNLPLHNLRYFVDDETGDWIEPPTDSYEDVAIYEFDVSAVSTDYHQDADGNSVRYDWQQSFTVAVLESGARLLGFEAHDTQLGPFDVGDRFIVAAHFDGWMEVVGTPQFVLNIGGTERIATYVGTGDTDSPWMLPFEYTVVEGDLAFNGVTVPENAFRLNGATLTRLKEDPDLPIALGSEEQHLGDVVVGHPFMIDGEPYPTVQAGGSLQVADYGILLSDDESINPDATFTWTLFGSDSRLFSISSEGVLSFNEAPDYDSPNDWGYDGVYDVLVELTSSNYLTGSSRQHTATFPVSILVEQPPVTETTTETSTETTTTTTESVSISSVAVSSTPTDGNSYGAAESIVVSLTFSGAVTVSDMTSASVTLQIGSNERSATYSGISDDGTVLSFSYTVAVGDSDPDGVEVKANSLTLDGGSIQDSAGTDASLAHPAFSAGANHVVSAVGGL